MIKSIKINQNRAQLPKSPESAKKSGETMRDSKEKGDHAFTMGNILEEAKSCREKEDFGRAAELYEWTKKYQEAAYCYFRNLEYLAAADNYLKINDKENAADMYELSREFNEAAKIFFELKKYRKAGELYERAGNYLKAGEAFLLANDNEKALLNLEMIKEHDNDFLDSLSLKAKVFLRMNEPQRTIRMIGEFIKDKEPNQYNVGCYIDLARAYENIRDFGKAKDLYKKILKFDPHNRDVQQKLIEMGNIIQRTIELGHSERYQKVVEIGRGAMGIVYRAEDLNLKRIVALKILNLRAVTDDSDIDRFFSEAQKVAQLHHPNIVTVFDVGKMGTDYFISMEYIEGKNLGTIIKEKHPISIPGILVIAKQLFTALTHSHQKGIIHRDIKPKNIMITYENDVKVVDFGIAALREELKKKDKNLIAGTPFYMSPEQIEGITTDHLTDIYSAGVTLFQLVTGQVPFMGSFLEIFEKHKEEPIPPIKELRPETPGKLIEIIEICMAKNKEDRYQTARQVVKEIERIRDNSGKTIITAKSRLKIFDSEEDTDVLQPGDDDKTEITLNKQEDTQREGSKFYPEGD